MNKCCFIIKRKDEEEKIVRDDTNIAILLNCTIGDEHKRQANYRGEGKNNRPPFRERQTFIVPRGIDCRIFANNNLTFIEFYCEPFECVICRFILTKIILYGVIQTAL